MSGMLCRDPEFWDWLHENEWLKDKTESACVEWLIYFLGVESRKELKTDSEARLLFNNLKDKFESWRAN
jgi:hypothetical protein